MRLATWNLNSLGVRLPHLQQWLAQQPVDVLALQAGVDGKAPPAFGFPRRQDGLRGVALAGDAFALGGKPGGKVLIRQTLWARQRLCLGCGGFGRGERGVWYLLRLSARGAGTA